MTSLGKYKLEELIGRGTYAEVYRAVDTVLRRSVALKLLKGAFLSDEEAVARFLQEARTGANLIHPQIAWVWDLGELDGRYFLAMRFIEGQTLDRLLESQGPLGWHEALKYLCQISDALVFAHENALVHRDIKPQNIMISPKEGAVLTDFGLVRAMEAGSVGTKTGALMGTPAYIAPEIWRGQPATPAADQYSLGCVVVEMLTGRRLFGGPTPPAVMQQHLLEGPQLPGDWPDDLSALVRQALSQDPAARFADMGAFRTALQSLQLNVAGQMATETNLSATRRPVLPPVVEVTTGRTPTWSLEEGLSALKDMEEAQEWQLAADQLAELEEAYPNHPRLKLPRVRITRALETEAQARREAEEKAKREAEA
ncbi:MAG TPA: serine/threonine-protein kinase, partial [Anaerolineaceae bacterium]|nr:serine/threonine-protein kinase [Anaerolineaceae bacterium]